MLNRERNVYLQSRWLCFHSGCSLLFWGRCCRRIPQEKPLVNRRAGCRVSRIQRCAGKWISITNNATACDPPHTFPVLKAGSDWPISGAGRRRQPEHGHGESREHVAPDLMQIDGIFNITITIICHHNGSISRSRHCMSHMIICQLQDGLKFSPPQTAEAALTTCLGTTAVHAGNQPPATGTCAGGCHGSMSAHFSGFSPSFALCSFHHSTLPSGALLLPSAAPPDPAELLPAPAGCLRPGMGRAGFLRGGSSLATSTGAAAFSSSASSGLRPAGAAGGGEGLRLRRLSLSADLSRRLSPSS